MKVLIVDNYDSFTFNLVHYFENLGAQVFVQRVDELDFRMADSMDAIVLSPGPGLPKDQPNLFKIIKLFQGIKPILGVCLGMQAIAEVNGGKLENQEFVKHGKREKVNILNSDGIFKNLPNEFDVGLYHSWRVDADTLPAYLVPTAISKHKVLMAIEAVSLKLFGVQFHPESILSDFGKEILVNFLEIGKD